MFGVDWVNILSEKENFCLTTFKQSKSITQDEFDILFCSKKDWFILDSMDKQNWSISFDKRNIFWETIEKIKLLFENEDLYPISNIYHYDFSFIQFPPITILNSEMMKIAWNDPISKFLDNRNCINFYKATFYGDFFIVNSSFNIALNFENCIFLENTKFRNVNFNKKEVFKKAIFKKSIIFDNVDFNDITIFKSATFKHNITFSGVTFNEHLWHKPSR